MKYDRITIYVEDKKDFKQWLKNLEIENPVVWEAEKREIYQAVYEVAQNHEDEVVDQLSDDDAVDDGDDEEKPPDYLYEVEHDYPEGDSV